MSNYTSVEWAEIVGLPPIPSGEFIRYKRVTCIDGFTMSVQGGFGQYSLPRRTSESYTAFEVGLPSRWEELLKPYAEDDDEKVFGYVHAHVIAKIIRKHGGIRPDCIVDLPPGIARYLVAK